MDLLVTFARITPTHVLIVLVIIVLLFGANKLPDLAKNVGKSAKILKSELKDLTEDEAPKDATPPSRDDDSSSDSD